MTFVSRTARWVQRSAPRRVLVLLAFAAAVGLGFVVWGSQGGAATAAAPVGLKATRGDLTVTVGAVGRIVQAGAATQLPPVAGSSTAAAGETPGSVVFPRASGQVTEVLVAPGDRVAAEEPLALLDDGGVVFILGVVMHRGNI